MKAQIAIVTTSRADYGLLCPLLSQLNQFPNWEFGLLVTGGHLSDDQGNTIQQIHKDGWPIWECIPMNSTSDNADGISQSIAKGIEGFSRYFHKKPPALLIVLGDRFELLACGSAALMHRIPVAHIHGGETTLGALDDTIRYVISSIASIHFTSLIEYREKLLRMGEPSDRIYHVGALGIDAIQNIPPCSREEWNQTLNLPWERDPFLLLTYHPTTQDSSEQQVHECGEVLKALNEYSGKILVTMPNTDAGGRRIAEILKDAALAKPKQYTLCSSLGHANYIQAMRLADCMIGNSSSGILEAASFGLPVVNVGRRQEGRIRPVNVIDSCGNASEISSALRLALSPSFRDRLAGIQNPYGDGHAAEKIVSILLNTDLLAASTLLGKTRGGEHA